MLAITCPHCLTSNRVPEAKLADRPKCGRCHQWLFTGKTVTLNSQNAKAYMEKNDIPLMIDLWAAWCAPCVHMAPAFEQAAAQLEPEIRLCKLDTDNESELAGRFGVRGIPTLILYAKGKELARHTGVMSSTDIVAWGRQSLATA